MKKRGIIFFLLFVFCTSLAGEEQERKLTVADTAFYKKLRSTAVISRDAFCDNLVNSLVQGRGEVKALHSMKRYRKRFMVIVSDSEAEKYGLTLQYFIFFDNREWEKILVPGAMFDFKGQCMNITPLDTRRGSYIIDLVLEHGALLIQ